MQRINSASCLSGTESETRCKQGEFQVEQIQINKSRWRLEWSGEEEQGLRGHKNQELCSGLGIFISFTFLIKRDKEWGSHQSHSDFPVKVLERAVNQAARHH